MVPQLLDLGTGGVRRVVLRQKGWAMVHRGPLRRLASTVLALLVLTGSAAGQGGGWLGLLTFLVGNSSAIGKGLGEIATGIRTTISEAFVVADTVENRSEKKTLQTLGTDLGELAARKRAVALRLQAYARSAHETREWELIGEELQEVRAALAAAIATLGRIRGGEFGPSAVREKLVETMQGRKKILLDRPWGLRGRAQRPRRNWQRLGNSARPWRRRPNA